MDPELSSLLTRAQRYPDRVAIAEPDEAITYRQLLERSARTAATLLAGAPDLEGARVAFLCPPGIEYVVAQWGIWRAGGIAVPLCTTHPAPELDYVLSDATVSIVICAAAFEPVLRPLAERRALRFVRSCELTRAAAACALPVVDKERGAMLLYTSGTTGRPKAVLSTHAILAAQLDSIATAWEWSPRDRVLHVLPLHHLHGILNLLCCALWSGACCEFLPRFDPEQVWDRIADRDRELTLFMAVPAIYAKLIAAFDGAPADRRARIRQGCERLRLMVSGSAALPASVLERFASISGHTLLERYGMTEFGMGLGNPLHGTRRPGYVGVPFPGVRVRLHDDDGLEVAAGDPGEIQIQGPGVFAGYFGRPDATAAAFTHDGWFRTGDIAVFDHGSYRILGRQSVDILKTGGYKVSALEIEEQLRAHPAVRECAVVGVADDVWGQRVAAVVVLQPGGALELEALRRWGKERLAPYKVPSLLRLVAELPRNAMGKVQKTELAQLFA